MSNTLTGLIPTIYMGLDKVARELIGIIPSVRRDSGIERAAKGQQITSFVAPAVTATDIVPAVTPPNDGDQTLGTIQLSIDNAKRVPIRWNGEEQLSLSGPQGVGVYPILADQFAQGFRTLANAIEADVVAKAYKAASRAYGTPGTAPFGVAGDFSDFANMHLILDDNGAPMSDRQLVLGGAAVSNLRGKQSILFKANEAGTTELLREGIIARVEGFDIHNSAAVKQITKGTGTGYLANAPSGLAIGATVIPVDTGTGTINPGDVVTFAGDPNKYVVVAGGASPTSITIGSPGLRQAVADNTAITLSNSFTPNLAFSRSSIVLGTRLPALPAEGDMAVDRTTVTDEVSGITFEIAKYLQYRQVQYEIAIVWGAAVTKQDSIAILQG